MRLKTLIAVSASAILLTGAFACKKTEAPPAEQPPQQAAQQPAAGAGINWTGFTDGMQKAKAAGKPVFVDFYATWCKWCVKLDETTYKDANVIETLNRDFIPIKVDVDGKDTVTYNGKSMTIKELTQGFKVEGLPTLVLFDSKGNPFPALPGYQTADDLMPKLTYITSGASDKGIKFDDYMKTLKK